MNRTYDKFQVVLLSEVKGKDSNAFIFELRLTSEDNCRIRIIDFDAFDIDGNKYSAGADKISTTDVILGHSKFFAETKKINVKISSQFKARIGCMAVLTVACIEDKQQMKFCFQRKGTNRWDCVGVEFMEYEGLPAAEEEPVETEGTLESVEELTDKAEKQVQAQTEAQTQTGASAVKEDGEEQAAVVVQDSPAEDIPAAQDEKAAAESLEEYLEREGAESVLGLSMKEFVNRFALGTQTVEDVLKQLNVNVAQEEEPAETISQPAPVSQPEEEEQAGLFMQQVISIVEANLTNPDFSAKSLASLLNLSQPTLYRKMKQQSNLSIIEVIRSIRISKAASLIMQKKYSVQEVAEMVGYNDINTFRKHFTNQFGVSPSRYNAL